MNVEDAVQMAKALQYKQLHQLFSPRQLSYPRERSQRPIFKGLSSKWVISGHHHWSCDTPGSNWQLSTLVSACHLFCQFKACPISVLLAWINKMSLCDSWGSNAQMASIKTLWSHYSKKRSHINELKVIKNTSNVLIQCVSTLWTTHIIYSCTLKLICRWNARMTSFLFQSFSNMLNLLFFMEICHKN